MLVQTRHLTAWFSSRKLLLLRNHNDVFFNLRYFVPTAREKKLIANGRQLVKIMFAMLLKISVHVKWTNVQVD